MKDNPIKVLKEVLEQIDLSSIDALKSSGEALKKAQEEQKELILKRQEDLKGIKPEDLYSGINKYSSISINL